jgi:hypothetical protein
MCGFSDDGKLVCAAHKAGCVAVYTRAGAHDIAPTDSSFFYREDVEEPGFFTEELTKALIRFPLMGNHRSAKGHNLITDIVRMRDSATLESVLNVQPANVPIYSYSTGLWEGRVWKAFDALAMAIANDDQSILYDLLMAMADRKVTPESWETFMGCKIDSKDGTWVEMCRKFSSLVLVFLTRLSASKLDVDVDYADPKGKLNNDGFLVVGNDVYMPDDAESCWIQNPKSKPSLLSKSRKWVRELWTRHAGEEGVRRVPEEDRKRPVTQKCIASRIDIPWIARAGKHGFLKALVESECPAVVYGTPIVRAVLQYKWEKFGKREFATECLFHFLQLVTFTTFALLYSDVEPTSCRDSPPGPFYQELVSGGIQNQVRDQPLGVSPHFSPLSRITTMVTSPVQLNRFASLRRVLSFRSRWLSMLFRFSSHYATWPAS